MTRVTGQFCYNLFLSEILNYPENILRFHKILKAWLDDATQLPDFYNVFFSGNFPNDFNIQLNKYFNMIIINFLQRIITRNG